MFGDPISNPYGWDIVAFNDCLESIENGKSFVCDSVARADEKPAILKLSAATYGVYKPEENKAIINEEDFVESAEVHAGDLLFTRKNTPELVGMAAYVESTPKKLMMPDLIFRLNTKTNCNKIFLWKLINHDLYRSQIESAASGSAKSMSNISKERLGKLRFPLPTLELQEQFVDFVRQVDKSKVVTEKALNETQKLFDRLIQEYVIWIGGGLMAIMTVYHGGYETVECPEIRVGRNTKDFGTGFYCTIIKEQAQRWARRYDTKIVSIYDVRIKTDLKIKEFKEMTEEWLDFIIACRSGEKHNYDIVIGAMADDQVYNYISDYMDGTITREQFWVLARFKYPTHQIVFCTEDALQCLEYRGFEEVV